MKAFIGSMSDQTLLKSDGNISNISSENEHSSINSNNSVIDDSSSWMPDDGDYNPVSSKKEQITLLSPDSDEEYDRARKVIELDMGARLIYDGKS